jgi:hypothetical protein
MPNVTHLREKDLYLYRHAQRSELLGAEGEEDIFLVAAYSGFCGTTYLGFGGILAPAYVFY